MKSTMRFAIVITVAVLVLSAGLVSAQSTTTGSIRGTVTDPNGDVMPGVTVRALSEALVSGQQAAVTSGAGVYRFPSLSVGDYVLEASMPGFQPVRQENIRVSLGQSLSIDLQLGDVTVSEEIVVVADAVQVSTVDNNVGFNLGENFIERQPLGRDPTAMMNYAPGIQNDQAYGAPSTYQNAYNVDGVDVSDPELGSQWVLPSMDWVEEMQVAGLGADAEYGGFTGAMVNLVTKSGGNEFHGDARLYYSGGGLNSENTPEGSEGANKVKSDIDGSASFGGPIIRDSLWYFVSGNMRQRVVEPFYTEGAPSDDQENSDRTESRVLGKLTWQINEANHLRGFVDWDDVVHDYRGVGDLTLASASQRQESPNYVYSVSWDSLINSNNFLEAKLTGYSGSDDRLAYHGDISNHYDAETGFDWQNLEQATDKDVSRLAVDASWNLFADGVFTKNDSHSAKFGVNYEQSNSDYVSHRNGGFSYYDDSYYCDSIDDYFADPFCGIYSSTFGSEWNLKAEMEGFHFFAQDSWQVGNLAINVGVRYSKYIGNFKDPISAPTAGGSNVYDQDMWAPRIGLVWDILGSGKFVFKTHYGVYYEGMTVTMFDREASGDALSDAVYLDYNFDTGEFDIPAGGSVEARAQMDPRINHPSVDQFIATLEYQVMPDMVLGIDYIQRDYKNINTMVVSNDGDYDPQTTIASPVDSPAAGGHPAVFRPARAAGVPHHQYRLRHPRLQVGGSEGAQALFQQVVPRRLAGLVRLHGNRRLQPRRLWHRFRRCQRVHQRRRHAALQLRVGLQGQRLRRPALDHGPVRFLPVAERRVLDALRPDAWALLQRSHHGLHDPARLRAVSRPQHPRSAAREAGSPRWIHGVVVLHRRVQRARLRYGDQRVGALGRLLLRLGGSGGGRVG